MNSERRETIASIRKRLIEASIGELALLVSAFSGDERSGIISAITTAEKRITRHRNQALRHQELLLHENSLWATGFHSVAGVDEVGRGALAGPLVAAAVALDCNTDDLVAIDDSKVMSADAREKAFDVIHRVALAVSVSCISHIDIDRYGIGVANDMALSQAVAGLDPQPDYLLSDAFKVDSLIPSMNIIKGDSKSLAIAAASVVAKVTRDRIMIQLDSECPGFGLASNKGYGSKHHMRALSEGGPSKVHRLSFAPSGGTQTSLNL